MAIVNYTHPVESLLHDEEAYQVLFGAIFPVKNLINVSQESLEDLHDGKMPLKRMSTI